MHHYINSSTEVCTETFKVSMTCCFFDQKKRGWLGVAVWSWHSWYVALFMFFVWCVCRMFKCKWWTECLYVHIILISIYVTHIDTYRYILYVLLNHDVCIVWDFWGKKNIVLVNNLVFKSSPSHGSKPKIIPQDVPKAQGTWFALWSAGGVSPHPEPMVINGVKWGI